MIFHGIDIQTVAILALAFAFSVTPGGKGYRRKGGPPANSRSSKSRKKVAYFVAAALFFFAVLGLLPWPNIKQTLMPEPVMATEAAPPIPVAIIEKPLATLPAKKTAPPKVSPPANTQDITKLGICRSLAPIGMDQDIEISIKSKVVTLRGRPFTSDQVLDTVKNTDLVAVLAAKGYKRLGFRGSDRSYFEIKLTE